MKKSFRTTLFGYGKKQVNEYLNDIKEDYEQELSKKKHRMLELDEENRALKAKLQEYEARIASYEEQEAFISKALVKAEQKAQAIIEEGHKKITAERYKLEEEKNKWKIREKEIRRQLLEFEKEVYNLMESFYSEINYLASKEICAALLEEDAEGEDDKKTSILKASSM
mgnify:CR=1 FL=1